MTDDGGMAQGMAALLRVIAERDAAIARADAAEAARDDADRVASKWQARAVAAEAAIAAVRALHSPRLFDVFGEVCANCGTDTTAYPCATIRSLDTGATT